MLIIIIIIIYCYLHTIIMQSIVVYENQAHVIFELFQTAFSKLGYEKTLRYTLVVFDSMQRHKGND